MNISPQVARRIVQAVAVGRIGLGAASLVAPRRVLRPWVGERGDDSSALVLIRAVGGRDVALGLGAVLAMRHGEAVRGWAEGGALADLVDALATASQFRRLPDPGRWAVLALAGGSAALSGALARQVDTGR